MYICIEREIHSYIYIYIYIYVGLYVCLLVYVIQLITRIIYHHSILLHYVVKIKTKERGSQATEDRSEEIEQLRYASELEKQALIDQHVQNVESIICCRRSRGPGRLRTRRGTNT